MLPQQLMTKVWEINVMLKHNQKIHNHFELPTISCLPDEPKHIWSLELPTISCQPDEPKYIWSLELHAISCLPDEPKHIWSFRVLSYFKIEIIQILWAHLWYFGLNCLTVFMVCISTALWKQFFSIFTEGESTLVDCRAYLVINVCSFTSLRKRGVIFIHHEKIYEWIIQLKQTITVLVIDERLSQSHMERRSDYFQINITFFI